MKTEPAFTNKEVAAVFKTYPMPARQRLLELRRLIFEVAAATEGVGEIEEALRWGQPSYLTTASKSGSLIRIDQIRPDQDRVAMYFHCQTTLVDSFKEMYRDEFHYSGNRSIILDARSRVSISALRHCIAMALTYHLTKKQRTR